MLKVLRALHYLNRRDSLNMVRITCYEVSVICEEKCKRVWWGVLLLLVGKRDRAFRFPLCMNHAVNDAFSCVQADRLPFELTHIDGPDRPTEGSE